MELNADVLYKSCYLCIAEGSVAVAVNLPLTVAMLSSKKLRKQRVFRVLTGICVADAIFGLGFILSGISRIQLINKDDDPESHPIPRRICALQSYVQLIAISFQLQGVLPFAVTVDRLFAVLLPLKYYQFGGKYDLLLGIGPYFCVAIFAIANAILTFNDETPVTPYCLTRYAVNSLFYSFILLQRITCIAISTLLYLAIATKLYKLASKEKAGRVQKSMMRRSTITAGFTTINAFVFLLIQDLINATGCYDLFQTYSTAFASLSMTNVILNACILFFRHRDIRRKLLRNPFRTQGRRQNHVAAFVLASSRISVF